MASSKVERRLVRDIAVRRWFKPHALLRLVSPFFSQLYEITSLKGWYSLNITSATC